MGQITVFKTIESDSQSHFYDISEVLDRIKRGVNKQLIADIRAEPIKQKRDNLKKRLLWICFSGKFGKRNNESMIQHSGFICLDFDGIPEKDMNQWRSKIKSDNRTYSIFTSPSGNGLKAVWKIPECQTNEEHNRRFEAISEIFKDCKYFDLNVKGWSRVCFESFDPNIYINQNADIFDGIIEHQTEKPRQFTTQILKLDDFNTVMSRIEELRIDITSGYGNWLNIGFALATEFDEQGRSLFHRISSLNSEYYFATCDKQYDACLKNNQKKITIKSFFDIAKESGVDIFTGHGEDVPNVSTRFAVSSDDLILEPEAKKNYVNQRVQFWTYSKRGAIQVDYMAMKRFLESNGFYKYRFNPEDISFIRIVQNIVSIVTIDNIRDFVLHHLYENDETEAYNLFAGDSKFKKEYIAFLEIKSPSFIKDTVNDSWVFYRNTAVCVSNKGIELVPYIDLDGYIWERQKIDRDFYISNYETCDFAQFMINVSAKDGERLKSLCSGMGYMMHRFKNPSTVRSLIFVDEKISDGPVGGTGKGLIFQAISKIRVSVFIDGKTFNAEKSFVWQRVNPDTEVVVLDDTKKNFNFDLIFSILTTGWPIEKKNKGEIYLSPAESPKIGIPTNNVLRGNTTSHERRKFEIEFYPHYSDNHQPIDDFNRNFWIDWDVEEWVKFDNLMMNCIRLFLGEGLIKANYVNLQVKKLIVNTSDEFYQFALSGLKNNFRYNRNEMFKSFEVNNPGSYCKSANQFYDWMREWGRFNNWKTEDVGSGRMFIQYGDVKSEPDLDNNEIPF